MTEKNNEVIPYSEAVRLVRNAIEDRAAWYDLLTKEAEAAGADPETVARRAIHTFGRLRGGKMESTESLEKFISQFANKLLTEVFEMELVKLDEEEAELRLHHCPLVESWKKSGNPPERIDALCRWAVEGDHGLMENFPEIGYDPETRIAEGAPYCKFIFSRKPKE